ncbi:MAG TPA: HAMP domain-containing sensor histidine kinase [Gemmatimonadaceae bacterium]|nr:HAMP domain-containing sensor histidine kinase [Gemmatimonadaceae bacterium]
MTLRARLAVGLAIMALVLVVPLAIAREAMTKLHDDVTQLRDKELKSSLALGNLRDALAEVRAGDDALGIVGTDTVYQRLTEAISLARVYADSLTLALQDTSSPPRTVRTRVDELPSIAEQEYALVRAGLADSADGVSQQLMLPALLGAERALNTIERGIRNRTTSRVRGAEIRIQEAESASAGALAIAIVLATVIGLWLLRSISGPVTALDKGMRAVAEGELEHRLDLSPQRRDEFGRLAASFSTMSKQLKELDTLKAEFVSVASHELKTPINVILGYLQLMQSGIYGPLSSKQAEVLATVESQGRTLARLAAQLLDVTRFEAGGGRIDPRPVRLATLLEDLERAFHVLAVQRGVDFRVTMGEGLPDEVQWDADRMNEVLGNLLANAFKFTGSGGTVELSAAPSDGQVRIEVRDTGAGIPPEQLPHIFEKFYQADNQGAASAPGTGLGLAIAKEIVEAHRGQIHCESVFGKGTTFTLLLPNEVHFRRHTGQHRIAELEAVS